MFLSAAFSAISARTPPAVPLTEYAGTYEYEGGRKIEIVAGEELFAVLDQAKYVLHASATDVFLTAGGQKLPFRRDANGTVLGFEENGHFYRRLSSQISAESASLAIPFPKERLPYRYRVPADRKDGIAVGDIAQTELGADLPDKIVQGILNGAWKDVHSILLYQHGKLVLEEYFYGYTVDRQHQLRSATKSVVATLAGIAVDEHAIASVNEPVLPHMTYSSYGNPDPRKCQITLRDMLSMQSGLACNDHDNKSPGNEVVIDEKPDWVKATLDLPLINQPGTKGFYCSGGVAVVGRMVENATHAYLPDFAQKNLFAPLGIQSTQYFWNYKLTNENKEYSQIHLRPRDMLKLGIMYKDEGRWQGKQVLSASFAHDALSAISQVDDTSYGYFWWRPWLHVGTPAGSQHVYMGAAQGNGGQKIYILSDYDLVAVFTGGAYNAGGSAPNKIMAGVILPKLVEAREQKSMPGK